MADEKLVNSNNMIKILNQLIVKYSIFENIVISCIFKNSKILAFGISKPFNNYNNDFGEHAEVNACSNMFSKFSKQERKKIGNVDILTTRFTYDKITNDILLKPSQPCQFCIKSLKKVNNIKRFYFTKENNIYKYEFSKLYENIDQFKFSSGDKRIHRY